MTALLEVEDLTAAYGQVRALHGVDLTVGEGQVVALLGPNGAGKTTTLRSICGMVRAGGRIAFRGRDLTGLARPRRSTRLGIAHVPEGRGTFPGLTVEENLQARRVRPARRGRAARHRALVRASSRGWPTGGTSRPAACPAASSRCSRSARALMSRPTLLLLDEPSLGLAPLVVREVFAVLGRIRAEQGTGMLLVEQNAALALELADAAYVLAAGRTVLSGPASEIRAEDSVRRSYLGQ